MEGERKFIMRDKRGESGRPLEELQTERQQLVERARGELETVAQSLRDLATASEGTENKDTSPDDEWATLSNDLFTASISRTDLLIKEFALDAKFASNVIDRKDVNPNEMSEKNKQEMTEFVAEVAALKMTVFKKIHEINTKKQPLNVGVFGGQEQYTALTNEAAKDVTKWLAKS